jgi:xanthine dehydrogenase accessory factor
MVDRRQIVGQWRQGAAQVLVTLVRAEGSSYRRPGAHLLIGSGGECAGTISGGCLETEVVRKAAWKVRGGAVVERYSTMFDDTAEIPYGLGCGGVVDLLLEPADAPECRALLAAIEASLGGTEALVATWLPEAWRPLARAIVGAGGELVFASDGLSAAEIASVLVTNRRAARGLAEQGVYVQTLAPPQRLFVLGAGDDAKPVATLAALLGWRVTVADGRGGLARSERFPEAERVLVARSADELGIRNADAVVLMTHSYEQDRVLLTGLLAAGPGYLGPGYIGLLGALHRSSLLVSEAAAALGRSVAECCERIYAPVGLDLGGDGPEAIALAVIAEVQAWVQGKLARSRRLTVEEVAVHVAEGGGARYSEAQCAIGAAELAGP